jgi:hypothetical protein
MLQNRLWQYKFVGLFGKLLVKPSTQRTFNFACNICSTENPKGWYYYRININTDGNELGWYY